MLLATNRTEQNTYILDQFTVGTSRKLNRHILQING